MRMMMRVGMDTERANEAARNGTLASTIKSILDDLQPESAHFIAADGRRTGVITFDIEDESQIPAAAEPWFLAFDATVSATPAMTVEDLAKGGDGMQKAVDNWG